MNNTSVYLHIPFCKRKCRYCDFFSSAQTEQTRQRYVDALCCQIRASEPQISDTVYFGGGTPSILTATQFSQIFEALRETLQIGPNAEITVEMNPDSVSEELLQVLFENGVNRISLGAQSFRDAELQALGRLHSAEQIRNAVQTAKKCGFSNISLDLMLGIPLQTADSLQQSLEDALALDVPHLSVYLLKVERNTPFFGTVTERSEEEQESFYLQTHDVLTAHGYEHYEISNFAKHGFRSRHNTNYWLGGIYLAFGSGAHGFQNGVRYFYPRDLAEFLEKNGHVLPTVIETVDEAEAARERILLGLRLSDGIPLDCISQEKEVFLNRISAAGLAVLHDGRLSLTERGFLVSNTIISELL